MKCVEELKELGIEECPECHCVTSTDWEYKDFSNKTIAVCPQCGTEISLENTDTNITEEEHKLIDDLFETPAATDEDDDDD